MQILSFTQNVLKYIGLMYTYSDKLWYRLYRGFVYMNLFCLYLPMVAYAAVFLADIGKATESFILLSAVTLIEMKINTYLLLKDDVLFIFINLQEFVDKAMKAGRTMHYKKAEKLTFFLSTSYFALMEGTVQLILFLPLLLVGYWYLAGKELVWILPLKTLFPFDTETSPGYEIAYIFTHISFTYFVSVVVAIDNFYIGMSTYVIACLRDIEDMIININQLVNESDAVIKKEINRCVELHIAILSYIQILAELLSVPIFFGFFLSVSMLCTLIFQLTPEKNIGEMSVIICIICCDLMELGMFCYFSHAVKTQENHVAETMYELNWYEFSPYIRRHLILIMQQAQNAPFIKGLKIINGSLESFTTVLNMAGSMVAVLYNVQKKI